MKDNASTSIQRLALRPSEYAEALGVSERNLANMREKHGLPYVKTDQTVLHPIIDVQNWLSDQAKKNQTNDTTLAGKVVLN